MQAWVRQGLVQVDGAPARQASEKVDPECVRFMGEALDHPEGLTLVYHKPVGSVCSHREQGRLIYEDFPERWSRRKPALCSVGRLDKDTSGLLILTDDGQLNHALTSPRRHVPKVYDVELASAVDESAVALFASGQLMLEGEERPCLPAELSLLTGTQARLTLHEGRYHQARRMFAAIGNHVVRLHRSAIGGLKLADLDLEPGAFCLIEAARLMRMIGCRS